TREVQLTRRVAQPFGWYRPPRVALHVRDRPRRCNRERLILEAIALDDDSALRRAVEDQELRLRRVLLAWHRIAVALERRARLGERGCSPHGRRHPADAADR